MQQSMPYTSTSFLTCSFFETLTQDMKFLLASVLLISLASVQANPISYIPYAFGYSTADGMSRQEQGSNGVVIGSYSYTDANGDLRQVKYTADHNGFRPEGDISVDRKTAQAAAELAALAPKAPAASSAFPAPAAFHSAPAPAPFQSFSSFQGPMPSWNSVATPVSSFGSPVAYQVDTPTHKIWVKY